MFRICNSISASEDPEMVFRDCVALSRVMVFGDRNPHVFTESASLFMDDSYVCVCV